MPIEFSGNINKIYTSSNNLIFENNNNGIIDLSCNEVNIQNILNVKTIRITHENNDLSYIDLSYTFFYNLFNS